MARKTKQQETEPMDIDAVETKTENEATESGEPRILGVTMEGFAGVGYRALGAALKAWADGERDGLLFEIADFRTLRLGTEIALVINNDSVYRRSRRMARHLGLKVSVTPFRGTRLLDVSYPRDGESIDDDADVALAK